MRVTPEGRRLSFALLIVAATTLFMSRSLAQTQTTVAGELVETFCWAGVRIGGPQHAQCAIQCARRGIPIAVYDAKARQSYILLPARDKASLPPQLIEAMGQNVTIRGEVFRRAGNQFLTVQAWQKSAAR